MKTNTELANMAISHCGSGKEIDNLDTERSQEGSACRRFFDSAFEQVLRDFDWPFAKRYAALALVTDNTGVPNKEWRYEYRYPASCVKIIKVASGARRDSEASMVPYGLSSDASGALVLCDMPLARVEYTVRGLDKSLYPADFDLAFSYLLASMIAPRLTGGDPFKRGQACLSLYFEWMSKAQANAMSELQNGAPIDSEFIRAREE